MTETRLLDYSFARPGYDQIKASGAVGVMRYLTRNGGAKVLSADEAKQIRAAGLWLGVVFEDSANRAAQGGTAGHDDAIFAAQQARGCGIPTTCPIFFAVDYDARPADVLPYFQGIQAAKISNPCGVYGSLTVVEAMLGTVAYGWQSAAWSGGKLSSKAHLYQRNSSAQPVAGTDENVLLKPLPLWGAPEPVAAQAVSKPAVVHPHLAYPGHVLHHGMTTDPAVDSVQRYFHLPVTRRFDDTLAAKVAEFRRTHRIPGPAEVDAAVWKAMFG